MEKQTTDQNQGVTEGESKKNTKRRNIALVAIIVVIVVIASAFALGSFSNPKNQVAQSFLKVTDHNMTTISIPMSSISKTATWYEYNVSGAAVRFFAVLDDNGTLHTAFDECPLCYEAHLGFRQEGSSMIEKCCNMPFPIDQINATGCSGDSCCPIYMPSVVNGDTLIIKKSTLAAERFKFLTANESAMVSSYNSTSISIPVASVSQNATWYQYAVNGTAVRFFAVKDTDGVIHTSMDICPKCYKKHAGFRQQNETNMVENCCNMAFKIKNITSEGCSIPMCHPAYVANQVIEDKVVIAIADLRAGAHLFA